MSDFPHRALPVSLHITGESGKGDKGVLDDTDDSDTMSASEAAEKQGRGPGLHLRHLSVLTTILHRCLLEGDIPRASRAWAMLMREQFWGHAIDIKGTGYWAIGAELLARSGEGRGDDGLGNEDGDHRREGTGRRWGSAEGWEKAKAYYEQLILQYPYRRQFQRTTNAVDFWPAMIGCEIYGIQWEEKEGLRKLEIDEENGDDGDESDMSDESEGPGDPQDDPEFAASQRRIARRLRRRDERIWQAREDIRLTTLRASEAVVARMDTLMSNHPYMDSRVLLRLRAMLALYIGDLSVPALPVQQKEEPEEDIRSDGMDREHKLLLRRRQAEHHRGKETRNELRASAQALFDRILKKGGFVGDVNYLELDEDDAGEDEA